MWQWIRLNWPLLFALLGVLVVTGVIYSARHEELQSKQAPPQNQAASVQQRIPGEGGTYVVERHPSELRGHQGAFGTPLTAEEIIALFTIFLTLSTAALWLVTERLAKLAAQADRPNLLCDTIKWTDTTEKALKYARMYDKTPHENIRPWAHVKFTNYGPSPARIIRVAAVLKVGALPVAPDYGSSLPLNVMVIIAPGKSDTFVAKLSPDRCLSATEVQGMHEPFGFIRLYVRLEYADVRGQRHVNRFAYYYAPPHAKGHEYLETDVWQPEENSAYWEYT